MKAAWVAELASRADEVFAQWESAMSRTLSPGRSVTVQRSELRGVFEALSAGVDTGESSRDAGFAELRALLSELSTSRAREGYAPTETAALLLSLKDAV